MECDASKKKERKKERKKIKILWKLFKSLNMECYACKKERKKERKKGRKKNEDFVRIVEKLKHGMLCV